MSDQGIFSAILMFGPPGVGKGTMSQVVAQLGGHVHISSGAVFRSLSPDSQAGMLYDKYASRGELLPDKVTIDIWYHHVQDLIAKKSYSPDSQLLILDGLPRTVVQAQMLEKYIAVKKIILMEVPDRQILIDRIHHRASVEGRSDDGDIEVFNRRIQAYEMASLPILQRYDESLICRCSANGTRLEVFKNLLIKAGTVFDHSFS